MIKYLFLPFVFCANHLAAQDTVRVQAVALQHYILDSFTKGTVLQKSGAVTSQPLNYNVLTGEMIFDAGGRYLAIAEPQNVDTVFIQNRKFVPIENKFYELLTNTAVPLFLEYTYRVQEPGSSLGYGAASNTAAATPLKTLINSGGAYALKLPDDFKVKVSYNYWVLKNGNFKKTNTAQQLINTFPHKKRFIADWVKAERTNFSKPNDVIRLVQQLDQ
jgi:hypothetical protein